MLSKGFAGTTSKCCDHERRNLHLFPIIKYQRPGGAGNSRIVDEIIQNSGWFIFMVPALKNTKADTPNGLHRMVLDDTRLAHARASAVARL
jgi:hypothetical protein